MSVVKCNYKKHQQFINKIQRKSHTRVGGYVTTIRYDSKMELLPIFENMMETCLQLDVLTLCTIYNMSGRVVSAYTNSSRRQQLYI